MSARNRPPDGPNRAFNQTTISDKELARLRRIEEAMRQVEEWSRFRTENLETKLIHINRIARRALGDGT